jgi:hypothetical protein
MTMTLEESTCDRCGSAPGGIEDALDWVITGRPGLPVVCPSCQTGDERALVDRAHVTIRRWWEVQGTPGWGSGLADYCDAIETWLPSDGEERRALL